MADEMPASTFAAWLAFYSIEPFGERRADFRSATIAAILHNVNKGPDGAPVTTADYMYHDAETLEEIEEEKQRAQMRNFIETMRVMAKPEKG